MTLWLLEFRKTNFGIHEVQHYGIMGLVAWNFLENIFSILLLFSVWLINLIPIDCLVVSFFIRNAESMEVALT